MLQQKNPPVICEAPENQKAYLQTQPLNWSYELARITPIYLHFKFQMQVLVTKS